MNKNSIQKNSISVTDTVYLYRIVFHSKYILVCTLMLLVSFLLQPITDVHADEGQVDTDIVQPSVVPEPKEVEVLPEYTAVTAEEPVAALTEVEEVLSGEEIVAIDDEVVSFDTQKVTQDTVLADKPTATADDAESNAVIETASTTNLTSSSVVATNTSENGTPEVSVVDDTETNAMATSTPETDSGVTQTAPAELVSTNASTTDEITPSSTDMGSTENSAEPTAPVDTQDQTDTTVSDTSVPKVKTDATTTSKYSESASSTATSTHQETQLIAVNEGYSINDSNRHQFGVDECVTVGDGAFYCSEAPENTTAEQDGVYAAPDSDGDMEIFVRLKGETQQLTHNITDDEAPYYDAKSKRIVWHRSVNDRYQIMSYDLITNEETQLTASSYNNMEPTAYGDITMWQSWIGNNWEIVKHEAGEVEVITNNDIHDIAPHMRGGHILWQTQFSEGWKVSVYNIETQEISYIENNGTPSQVANPRFVLVFDSVDENGDARTLGYDFDSGSTITLGTLPVELPEKLPEPEQTGEERALIQSKPTTRSGDLKNSVDIDTDDTSSVATTTASSAQSKATSTADIVILSTSESAATTTREIATEEVMFEAVTSTSSVDHISDIVIPPRSTTTDEVVG